MKANLLDRITALTLDNTPKGEIRNNMLLCSDKGIKKLFKSILKETRGSYIFRYIPKEVIDSNILIIGIVLINGLSYKICSIEGYSDIDLLLVNMDYNKIDINYINRNKDKAIKIL